MRNGNKQFGVLAQYYDILNYNADYKKVADYIEDVFKIYGKSPELILDLACGTGSLAIELDKRGYDMIGLDMSAEMLSRASMKKPDILWINQDMCGFELYGTVDAVVCCFDSLNYIMDEEKIDGCFGLVRNYLNPGGLFIFDVNSKYKFENIYADSNIVLENDGVFCSWQNRYVQKSRICRFYITLFAEQPDGNYKRYGETQKEKYYGADFFKNILEKNNFEDINIYCDFSAEKIYKENKNKENKNDKNERICFAAAINSKEKPSLRGV